MSSISLPDHDIGTDAEVETPQDCPMDQNLPERLLEPGSENNYDMASLPSEGSDNEKEYLNYVHLMKDLKDDYFDILILCAKADEDDAENFKLFLETHFSVDILVIGPVISHEAQSHFERAMFYFMYVTEEYLECSKSKLYADSFLAKSLSDKTKKGNVFPVLTSDKNECKLKEEILFGNMRLIQYYKKDKDIGKIRKILGEKAREIAERKSFLENSRRDYYAKNKSELTSLQALLNPGFLPMKLQNQPDLKLEDSGRNDSDHSKFETIGINSDGASIPQSHSFGKFEHKLKPEGQISFSGDIQVDGIQSNNMEMKLKFKSSKSEGSANNSKKLVGVFWDLQNCPVPDTKSAATIMEKIRERFISVDPNNEERCFLCITDAKAESRRKTMEINLSRGDVLHVDANKQNAADFKIIQKIKDFERDSGTAKKKIILISMIYNEFEDMSKLDCRWDYVRGQMLVRNRFKIRRNFVYCDIDFGLIMADEKINKFELTLIYNKNVIPELLAQVNNKCPYEDLLKDVPDIYVQIAENDSYLIVCGSQCFENEQPEDIKKKLEEMFLQWEGKVADETGKKFVLIKFGSDDLAKWAENETKNKELLLGEDRISVYSKDNVPDNIKKAVKKKVKKSPVKKNDRTKNQFPITQLNNQIG